MATDNGTVDVDGVLDVGEAHDHALFDLNIAIDEAGVADVGVLDYHAPFDWQFRPMETFPFSTISPEASCGPILASVLG